MLETGSYEIEEKRRGDISGDQDKRGDGEVFETSSRFLSRDDEIWQHLRENFITSYGGKSAFPFGDQQFSRRLRQESSAGFSMSILKS